MQDVNASQSKSGSTTTKRKTIYLILVGVILLAIPLFFIFRPNKSNKKDNVKDLAALEKEVEKEPSYENLINLSVIYVNNKQSDRAIPLLKKALLFDPQGAVAYNNLGVAYIEQKHYKLAIDACKKALELDGNLSLAANNLKWALDEQRDVLDDISKIESDSGKGKDASYYTNLSLNYYRLGNYDKSLQLCEEGLLRNKRNISLMNNKGANLVMTRRFDEAMRMFDSALNADPSNQLTKNNIIWAKTKQME